MLAACSGTQTDNENGDEGLRETKNQEEVTDNQDTNDTNANDQNETPTPTPESTPEPIFYWPEGTTFPRVYEAEDARLLGRNTRVSTSLSGFSGEGYVAGFQLPEDACEFTIFIGESGFFDLNFVSASGPHGYKENRILVNGTVAGIVIVDNHDFTDSILRRVWLDAGTHTIRFSTYWGWMYLDRLEITPSPTIDPEIFNVPYTLVNPNANEAAQSLMRFLTSVYGTYILTGQYSDYGVNGAEFAVIREITGRTPAVMGLDMMDYTPSRVQRGTRGRTVEHAIEFHNMGGIVTFCWHWNAPEDYITGTWYRAFFTNYTNINLRQILDGEDERGFELLMRDIDAIAEQLLRLQDAGIPVLWRPLHEASGGWFWWGASGPEAQIELWRLMFNRLTHYHGLNNLIWLWNGEHADWYPGDEYVDIIGEDPYPGPRVYTSQIELFLQAKSFTDAPKMVVMSENGSLFDPDLAVRDGAMWGFFATWKREFVLASRVPPVYSEVWTERWMLEHVYAHERTLTLEDLPDWQNPR